MDKLVLEVAGFFITITFHKNWKDDEQLDYIQELKLKEITSYVKNFISSKKIAKGNSDSTIDFFHILHPHILTNKKSKMSYILLYEKKGNKIITYYHINNYQFHMLFQEILYS